MGLLRSIIARVGMDGTDFDAGAKKVENRAAHMGHEVAHEFTTALAAAFSIEAAREAIHATVEYGAHLVDLSHRLAMSTDSLQVWDYALKRNGSSLDQATPFFEKLAAARDKALGGGANGAKFAHDFRELGVSIDDLKSKRIEDIAEQLSEVFATGGDAQQLVGALREVGGRGAGDMIATLRDGIAESRAEAIKLGLVIENGTLLKLKEAADRAVQFGAQLRAAFAPWIAELVEGLQYAFSAVKAGVLGVSAAMAVLAQHPTHFKEAGAAFMEQEHKGWEEMIEADRALKQKANRDAAAKPVGAIDDDSGPSKAEITALKKIEELNRQIAEAQRHRMTAEEKRSDLIKEQAQLYLDLQAAIFSGKAEESARLTLEIEKTRNQLFDLNKPKNHHQAVDSLQRIGISVGGAENVMLNLAREQLHQAHRAANGIEKIVAHHEGKGHTPHSKGMRDQ